MGKRYTRKHSEEYPKEWYEELCRKIDDTILKNKDKINLFICAKIAYKTLHGLPRYKISHGNDPYYDHSGELVEESIIKSSDFGNVSFSEFCSMYSGDTMPTYCSGCGLAYTDYSESVDEWIRDAVSLIQDKAITGAILGRHPEFAGDDGTLSDAVFEIRDKIDDETLAYRTYDVLRCLPIHAENWTLGTIRQKGLFFAMQIEKNREEYRKAEEEAKSRLQQRAEAVDLKPGMPRVSGITLGLPYITKNDREALDWLEANYTPEEIELLIISRKIFVSGSLDSEYHALRRDPEYNVTAKGPMHLDFSMIYH